VALLSLRMSSSRTPHFVIGSSSHEGYPGLRVAPMYRHIYSVEAVLEKAFIGLELERFWHDAVGIRDHAIFGDDRLTFYSTGGHGFLLASAGYDPEHRSGQRAITQAKGNMRRSIARSGRASRHKVSCGRSLRPGMIG
jgi:hypothetical protein